MDSEVRYNRVKRGDQMSGSGQPFALGAMLISSSM